MAPWPDAWRELEAELLAGRGRPALVEAGAADVAEMVDVVSTVVGQVVSVGKRLTEYGAMPPVSELLDDIAGPAVLVDLDVLFAPALELDVLSQLRRMVLGRALVVAWPGRIRGGRLSYSAPGRGDYVDVPARDLIVLHPVVTQFPDEVPYLVEKFV